MHFKKRLLLPKKKVDPKEKAGKFPEKLAISASFSRMLKSAPDAYDEKKVQKKKA